MLFVIKQYYLNSQYIINLNLPKMLLAIGVSLLIVVPIFVFIRPKPKKNKNPVSNKVDDKDYWDYLTKD